MFNKRENLKIHFIGIGGIGMSGIAEILLRLGYQVSGSDLEEGERTAFLKELGAEIHIGHNRSNIDPKIKVIVCSSAIAPDNPEIERGRELQIPLIKRAEMLAELMRLKYGVAVAGGHGKTTTSSMLATIMHECQIDITHIIGGVVSNFGGNAKLGKSDFIVVEADESDGSFLLLNPVLSIITNIDNDHLDYYQSEEKIFDAFLEFSNKIPFYGHNSYNIHDEKIRQLIKKTSRPYLTYGVETECDYCARNLKSINGKVEYQLYLKNKLAGTVKLNMPGRHNVLNSLAAISIVHQIVPDISLIIAAIAKFNGVGRRFEKLYESGQFLLVDDYGHHPTEMRETFKTAKEFSRDNLIVLYEPHRFSRTRDCWDDFIQCLKIPDKVFLLPIYAASESPIPGITASNLALEISNAEVLDSFSKVRSIVDKYLNSNTLFLALGAGAIGRNIRQLVKELP